MASDDKPATIPQPYARAPWRAGQPTEVDSSMRTPSRTRAGLAVLAALAVALPLQAADENVFTQKPEVAEKSGAPAAPPRETIKAPPNLLAQGPTPQWIWGQDNNRRYVLRKT